MSASSPTTSGTSTGSSPMPSTPPATTGTTAAPGARPAPPAPAESAGPPESAVSDQSLAALADREGEGADAEVFQKAAGWLLARCEGDPKRLIEAGGGDLAEKVAVGLLWRTFPDQPIRRRAVFARMEEVRASVEGPNPTPVERLLCERVALAWLDLHIRDLLCLENDGTMTLEEHADRMRHRAHQRYTAALKALASVCKLDLPSIQINLARRQVNVAGNLASGGASSALEAEA